MYKKLLQWDKDVFVYLNSLGTDKYDNFWVTVTEINSWIPLFLLFLLLFVIKFPLKKAFFQVALVSLLAWFITFLTHTVKIWVERPRPCNDETINSFIRILKTPVDFSFFSGHASSSFAITLLVYLLLREKARWTWIFFVWPLLFSYSRIYVGVHFPLDILTGAIIGTLSAFLFYAIYMKFNAPDSRSNHP
ncbi:phosphatase PAP2 family protein [Flagellimonas sp. S3867]|uniref:phosphatase PAP2 family protein n=1 Tax=Flagellimonas sp. S3867 TaxID=2768063 RepID=UPI0016873DE7|nr:phosphatase PAP2 family protein [Flagellimonas sp. S3867]